MMRGLVMDFPPRCQSPRHLRSMCCLGRPDGCAGNQVGSDQVAASIFRRAPSGLDFWSGKTYAGGSTVDVSCSPIATMPLLCACGKHHSLWSHDLVAMAKNDPIELRVYPGADGAFTFYEDEGDNYNYEKGAIRRFPSVERSTSGP